MVHEPFGIIKAKTSGSHGPENKSEAFTSFENSTFVLFTLDAHTMELAAIRNNEFDTRCTSKDWVPTIQSFPVTHFRMLHTCNQMVVV